MQQHKKIQQVKHPHDTEYPQRINRFLHLAGVCSRRAADRLIADKQVYINGTLAELGQQVRATDTVTLGQRAIQLQQSYVYCLYNKPVGVVSHNPQHGEPSAVEEALKSCNISRDKWRNFAPVGRLDKASSGLMLITNDGRIIDRILNPAHAHTKVYEVTLDKAIKNMHIKMLAGGVDIEGYRTKRARVERIADNAIRITLTEGKKHQIRRMLAALGYQARTLHRTHIMHLSLGTLKSGQARALTDTEQHTLLTELGIV